MVASPARRHSSPQCRAATTLAAVYYCAPRRPLSRVPAPLAAATAAARPLSMRPCRSSSASRQLQRVQPPRAAETTRRLCGSAATAAARDSISAAPPVAPSAATPAATPAAPSAAPASPRPPPRWRPGPGPLAGPPW
eukprot:846625-Prymnesium_polylepis.1